MPYRKTRKQQRKQTRKTRHRSQRGGVGGIFRLFSKKPNAQLPYESYKSAINRLFLFLYSKVNASTPGYIPLSPSQKVLTLEQKEFFRTLLAPYVSRDLSTGKRTYRQEEFVQEVLGVESLSKLDKEIVEIESVGKPVTDVIYNRPAKGESFAGSLDRFLPVIFSSEQVIQYRQNWERNICALNPSMDQNRPIQGLYENRCIFILHDKDNLPIILNELQMVYGDSFAIGPGLPYILVEKQYLPQMDEKTFPYTRIKSTRLLETTFIKDAFEQDGVIEIQPDLAKVIAEEEALFWMNLPLVQIRTLSQVTRPELLKQKYLIVNDDTPLMNGQYISISRLPTGTTIYGLDPQTSILLRTKYTALWSQIVSDPNYTFFMFLSPQEQTAIANLQFHEFQKQFKKNPSTAIQVYSQNLGTKEVQAEFLRGINIDDVWKYEKILRKYV
jgi:hypothetical protein